MSPPAYLNAPSLGRGRMRPPKLHKSFIGRESPPSEVVAPPPDVAILYGVGGREGVLCEERDERKFLFFYNSRKAALLFTLNKEMVIFWIIVFLSPFLVTGWEFSSNFVQSPGGKLLFGSLRLNMGMEEIRTNIFNCFLDGLGVPRQKYHMMWNSSVPFYLDLVRTVAMIYLFSRALD